MATTAFNFTIQIISILSLIVMLFYNYFFVASHKKFGSEGLTT
jgi:hypothetical protein